MLVKSIRMIHHQVYLLNESKIEDAKKNNLKLNEILKNQIHNIQNIEINDLTLNFRELIEDITTSQEKYASIFGKNFAFNSLISFSL